jgi:hypothetical protein
MEIDKVIGWFGGSCMTVERLRDQSSDDLIWRQNFGDPSRGRLAFKVHTLSWWGVRKDR